MTEFKKSDLAITILKVSLPYTIFVVPKDDISTIQVIYSLQNLVYTFTVIMKMKACFTGFPAFLIIKGVLTDIIVVLYFNAHVTLLQHFCSYKYLLAAYSAV
jgi:hypothetical protein